MRTAIYDICPYCGAYLDPDEKCDCQEEKASPVVTPCECADIPAKTGNRWAIDNFKLTC